MRWPPGLSRLSRENALPLVAGFSVVIAIVVVLTSSGSATRVVTVTTRSVAVATTVHSKTTTSPAPRAASGKAGGPASKQGPQPHPRQRLSGAAPTSASTGSGLSLPKALGQLIVSGFAGTSAPPSILEAIQEGHVGGVILMGQNTAAGVPQTSVLTGQLQEAARAGGNPGLLIMTDQEGGEVKRLPGPPEYAAAQMSDPAVAAAQGTDTAKLLREVGVNVDLAPVADVARLDGFMYQEQRTFGGSPLVVKDAACAFAQSLRDGGVAYTLKHFPGLGSAIKSTDFGPVDVTEPKNLILDDDMAYSFCGNDRLALVMVSSASYANLTGSTPAVMSPSIYTLMPGLGIDAVTISDDFDSPAITSQHAPAETAINAGLDMVLYAGTESSALSSYQVLLQDAQQGDLSSTKVQAAAQRVLSLKRALGLT